MRTTNPTFKILAAFGVLAVIALIIVLAARAHNAHTRRCHNQGGTVVTDHDTKRVYDKTTGKWKTKTETEHECHVNGQEVNEW